MTKARVFDRPEALLAGLAQRLGEPLEDPFAAEWVVCPSYGFGQWLKIGLSKQLGTSNPWSGDGIIANVMFKRDADVRALVSSQGSPLHGLSADQLTWLIFELLNSSASDPLLQPLTEIPDGSSRLSRSRRIARLFLHYERSRPALPMHWAGLGDDPGIAIPQNARWQPHLFRELLQAMGAEESSLGQQSELDADILPHRITSLLLGEAEQGENLSQLLDGAGVDSAVFALVPTRVTDGENPLSRSWAVPAIHLLDQLGDEAATVSPDSDPQTLLELVQHGIRMNKAPSGELELAETDRSVSIHSCHGDTRQVEVLFDQILHVLDSDPSLCEEDIVVVCPSLEKFAPTVRAVFGPSARKFDQPKDGKGLRYRVVGRLPRSSDGLANAILAVCGLSTARIGAATLSDFVSLGPVRHRFGFDDDAVGAIGRWIRETNARWGLDGTHRSQWGLPDDFNNNTWAEAVDRLLMGIAVPEAGDDVDPNLLAMGDIATVDVEGDLVNVAGGLADLVAHLADFQRKLESERPVAEWVSIINELVERVLSVEFAEQWQLTRVREQFESIAKASEASSTAISFREFRGELELQLASRTGRGGLFSGGVTITDLETLDGVPHRVVCVLGLDDQAMRRSRRDGDDILAINPLPGDPDDRRSQRQQLLNAIVNAGDRLIITHSGRDVRTNQEVPDAVALAEFRSVLEQTVSPTSAAQLRESAFIAHPRQAHDPQNFAAENPLSFSSNSFAGAQSKQRPPLSPEWAVLNARLPALEEPTLALADLHAFLRNPVRSFFASRVDIRLPWAEDALANEIPLSINALEKWKLGTGLLQLRFAGGTTEAWSTLERAHSSLPPGSLGAAEADAIDEVAEQYLDEAKAIGVFGQPVEQRRIDVELSNGTTLQGEVGPCIAKPKPGPLRMLWSQEGPKYRLEAWLDLVVLTVAFPETHWRSTSFYRKSNKADIHVMEVAGHSNDDRLVTAVEALTAVVELYNSGMREPLPLFESTSYSVFMEGVEKSKASWEEGRYGSEQENEYNERAFGGMDFAALSRLQRRDYDPPGPNRLVAYANLLWSTVEDSVVDPTDDEAAT